MTAHHRQVSRRFDAAARTYAQAATIQPRVARQTLALIPGNFTPTRALDVGCGPGTLLTILRQRWPAAQLTGLDLSPAMLAQAREHLGPDPALVFHTGDAAHFADSSGFDLVASSSTLHWLRPFDRGLQNVLRLVRPGGFLAAGFMLDGTLAELREARAAAAPDKPAPAPFPAPADIHHLLGRCSLYRVRRFLTMRASLRHPSCDDLLRALNQMGVTSGDLAREGTPLTRAELARLREHYDGRFAEKGGVRATFVVGYLLVEHLRDDLRGRGD